jgi:hypothetical protein
MSFRENLTFETSIRSDTAALHGLVARMLEAVPEIRCLRDPTRGGLATTLNELATQSGVGIRIREQAIPVSREVAAACEFLGLDPLYVANEGKLVAICAARDAERLIAAMRSHPLGLDAAIIGEVIEDAHRFVQMQTAFGGSRVVDWLSGEQLPASARPQLNGTGVTDAGVGMGQGERTQDPAFRPQTLDGARVRHPEAAPASAVMHIAGLSFGTDIADCMGKRWRSDAGWW